MLNPLDLPDTYRCPAFRNIVFWGCRGATSAWLERGSTSPYRASRARCMWTVFRAMTALVSNVSAAESAIIAWRWYVNVSS